MLEGAAVTIQTLENVGIVVEDLKAMTAFFTGLGLTVLGEATVEGDWVDRVLGLEGVTSRIAMLQTPDGHGRLELMAFDSPRPMAGDRDVQPNTPGIRRIAFAVDDIDDALARLPSSDVQLLGEVVQYADAYRLCYLRGPEGIIVMLSQPLE